MMSLYVSLAMLSNLQYAASLKVDVDHGKSPALEAMDSLGKSKTGSGLVSGGIASLASAIIQSPEVKIDDSLASLREGEHTVKMVKLVTGSAPTTPKNEEDIMWKRSMWKAAQGSDVIGPAPQSALQSAEKTVVAKKQIARGRGSDASEPDKYPWSVWFQQIPQQSSWMKGLGLVLFLVIGIVVGLRSFLMLQSQCSSNEDSVLEEAWKPKQVTLTSEVANTVTSLANDTVATVTAAIDAASKLAEGQSEEPVKEREIRVPARYTRRHVSCPWPKEPELPAQPEKSEEIADTTAEHPPMACMLSAATTIAKVQLDDELGAWIPDAKDIAAELADSASHEDSTSAGDSEQALLDKLRDVASDGEDESVSPRHSRRCDSDENLDDI